MRMASNQAQSQGLFRIISGRLLHQLEFIHAPSDVRFGDIDISLRVDVQSVAMREFAELMAWASKLGDFVALVIENVDELIAAISDDHVFLPWIA